MQDIMCTLKEVWLVISMQVETQFIYVWSSASLLFQHRWMRSNSDWYLCFSSLEQQADDYYKWLKQWRALFGISKTDDELKPESKSHTLIKNRWKFVEFFFNVLFMWNTEMKTQSWTTPVRRWELQSHKMVGKIKCKCCNQYAYVAYCFVACLRYKVILTMHLEIYRIGDS